MREIKFRAISKHNEKFIYGYYLVEQGQHKIKYHVNETLVCTTEINDNTIGQYTGLKDNNGVEIWEGDIVKIEIAGMIWIYEVGITPNNGNNLYFLTRYRNFAIAEEEEQDERAYVMGDFYDCIGFTHMKSDCEVIGNIYEHPELINKRKSEEK